MRLAVAGLAAAWLFAFAPSSSEAARADAPRHSAKASQQARAPAAAARTAATPQRAAASRAVASRPVAAPTARGRGASAAARGQRPRITEARAGRGGAGIAIPYARHQAAPNPLRQMAMASCTVRQGRRVCGPGTRTVSFRWSQGGGMPPPTLAQTTCPDGTIATTAIGHNDVVRCVPL